MFAKYSKIIISLLFAFFISLSYVDASGQDFIERKRPPKPVNNVKKGGGKPEKKKEQPKQEPKKQDPKPKATQKSGPLTDYMIKPGESAPINREKILGGNSYNGSEILFRPSTMSIILESDQPEKVRFYNLVTMNGKTFVMGANSDDSQKVQVDAYYIGESEVPQWLWNAVMPQNPSTVKGDMLPVNNVTWNDCQKFIAELNKLLKKNIFYLPSEAQWEFAAKAGDKNCSFKYSGSNDLDDYAWYYNNSYGEPQDVKGKRSNSKGIYGMTGNVMEWCYDWYEEFDNDTKNVKTNYIGPDSGSDKVLRGGSFDCDQDDDYRIERRFNQNPDMDGQWTGFRIGYTFIEE